MSVTVWNSQVHQAYKQRAEESHDWNGIMNETAEQNKQMYNSHVKV